MHTPQRSTLIKAAGLVAVGILAVAFMLCLAPGDASAFGTTVGIGAVGLVMTRHQEGASLDYTPGSAVTAGNPVQLADGRVGVPPVDIAANRIGALDVEGVFKVAAASATTWSDGDELWYDSSASQAVPKSLALDGAADFKLGIAVGAKTSGSLFGYVEINRTRPLDPVVYEFDVQTGVDSDAHQLIPAEQNPNGLLILGIYGIVTEQMAGSTEDQGIVTVRDESNNTLATLTASDAAADAVNDIVVGYAAAAASTGDAGKVVAAGEYVDGQVTQETSGGSPAGKMKVYVVAVPLL